MDKKLISFIVSKECDNMNAKEFLKHHCNVSARMITDLKKVEMGITRNGDLLRTIDTVSVGDVVTLNLPDDKNQITPVKGDLNILYEDQYILVVDKPCNMPVHPTKIHQKDTLANIVIYHQMQNNEHYTFRAINRLDKDTSGIVVIAKDRYTAAALFGSLKKEYTALCEGNIENCGTIDKPIGILEGHSIQRTVREDGERSITHYKPIINTQNHTLLNVILETGHTHQIRCHFSCSGFPLAGDDMYGGSTNLISRQALHCSKIAFKHPVLNHNIEIESQLPNDIKVAIAKDSLF